MNRTQMEKQVKYKCGGKTPRKMKAGGKTKCRGGGKAIKGTRYNGKY